MVEVEILLGYQEVLVVEAVNLVQVQEVLQHQVKVIMVVIELIAIILVVLVAVEQAKLVLNKTVMVALMVLLG